MHDQDDHLPSDRKQIYADIFEQMGDGMVVTTMDGTIVDWNEAAEAMFGYTREEMLGKTPAVVMDTDPDAEVQAVLRELRDHGSWHETYRFVRKNGTKGHAQAFVRTIFDAQGEPYLTIGANRDITRKVEAEKQLRFASELLDQMSESLHVVRTTDLTIVYVNRNFEALFGYQESEILGQSVTRLNAPSAENPERQAARIIEVLERKGRWQGDLLNVKKDGTEFWSRARVTAHEHPEFGPCWISMHEDVTALRAEQERRTALERQLQRSQRLESLGTLAGGVAHDFNNILQGITLSLEALHEEIDDTPSLKDPVELGIEYAERGRRIVERILAFARSDSADVEQVALGELLERTARLIEPLLTASIEIITEIPPEPLYCRADPADLEQAIVNLCTNAGFAMRGSGGRLGLRLSAEDDDWLAIEVQDEGEGIPADQLGSIFDPFYTTKQAESGSGLGLAIVHSTVHDLGGTVNATSTVGAGTTFRIRLPRVAAEQRPPEVDDEQVIARLLVLDDEAALLRILERVLARRRIAVVSEGDPEAALSILRNREPDIDIIITDQAMPGMSGVEFAKQARRLRPELPILLMSGNIDPNLIDQSDLFDGQIEKPFRLDPLVDKLQGLLEMGARRRAN